MSITGSLIIFVLIWWIIFFSLLPIDVDRKHKEMVEGVDKGSPENPKIIKKIIYTTIITSIICIGIFTFGSWLTTTIPKNISADITDVNSLFFDEFFAVLIIVDVLLLLVTFFYTDKFHKVIRNSGFIISTILIRMSFTVDGVLNNILILAAIIFGLTILWIHNKFAKNLDLK